MDEKEDEEIETWVDAEEVWDDDRGGFVTKKVIFHKRKNAISCIDPETGAKISPRQIEGPK